MRSGRPRRRTATTASLALVTAALAMEWGVRHLARGIVRARAADKPNRIMGAVPASGGFRSGSRGSWLVLAGLIAAAAVISGGWWSERVGRIAREAAAATGGDPARALPIMLANGCAGCHEIPGIPGAQALVGPRLDGTLAQRVYIAGVLPNTPANLIRWLRVAREVDPLTAMPSTHIPEQ